MGVIRKNPPPPIAGPGGPRLFDNARASFDARRRAREVAQGGPKRNGDPRHLEIVARKIGVGWEQGTAVETIAAQLPQVGTVTWADLAKVTVGRKTTRGPVPERYVREVFDAAQGGDSGRYVSNPDPRDDLRKRCALCGGYAPQSMHPFGGHPYTSTEGLNLYMVGFDAEGDRYAVEVDPDDTRAAHHRDLAEEMQLDKPGRYDTWYVWGDDAGWARLESDAAFGESSMRWPLPPLENPRGGRLDDRLSYDDFYRTGIQDCHNIIDIDDFDIHRGGTPREVVEAAWKRFEDDGIMDQWIEANRAAIASAGLYPALAYQEWSAGWKSCATRLVERWQRDVPKFDFGPEENPSTYHEWPAGYLAGQVQKGAKVWHFVKQTFARQSNTKALCGKHCRHVQDPATIPYAGRGTDEPTGVNVCTGCSIVFGIRP